uniref:NADH-ubiquinone oxidoreductase chain 1 n=1 Tax=Setaphyes kielensis TaxID=3298910 RepID=A0A1I9VTT2_9BILA|nr:NADH dehydrogenase subunit 1 [Pycnophyes kielensis]APA17405.1 NADH dehydrogenase subunit 1 [Pycnophyes kielensis]
MYLFVIILVLGVLASVAFVTLLERKVMGYSHLRKGPNKVGFMGFLQPFADAGKLFMNMLLLGYKFVLVPYIMSVFVMVLVMLGSWVIFMWMSLGFYYSGFFFFCLVGLGVYPIIFSGWSSISKYSLLGSLRAVGQAISYEVCFILFFISMMMFCMGVSFEKLMFSQVYVSHMVGFWPFLLIFFILMLAELGRTPFDFVEGESELVSGFNVEYGSGLFAVIFVCEYGMILIMSGILTILFVGFSKLFYFFLTMLSMIFIFIRVEVPRLRYDKLMSLAWEVYLPLSLLIVMLIFLIS